MLLITKVYCSIYFQQEKKEEERSTAKFVKFSCYRWNLHCTLCCLGITLFFKVEFPKHWFQKGKKIFAEFKTTRDKTLRNKIL